MTRIILNLSKKIFEDLKIDPDDLYLTRLHSEIDKDLKDACTKAKASKQLKKWSSFLSEPLCNSFRETYDFGCNKKKINSQKYDRCNYK
jgi:hypothetical protein